MAEITSLNNELVKETVRLQQKKYREDEKKFLLEGFKAIEEAYSAGVEIKTVFVMSEKADNYDFIKDKIILTNEAVLKKISTTDSAPESVAVGIQKKYDKSVLNNSKKVLLLENIKDTGNLGTIIRTSVAFGVDAIVLYGESVDLYNPKCVRASVGNLWKIPVVQIRDLSELKEQFKNYEKIATLPKAKTYLKDFSVNEPWLLMFGSEAEGLGADLINIATKELKIEMPGNVESLNLSISCGIVLYELLIK